MLETPDPLRIPLAVLYLAALVSLAWLALRPHATRERTGKVLAFFILILLPGLALQAGALAHLERSKATDFCLSCHVMEEHGRSLWVDDPEFLAATHYQNAFVPQDKACFTCHTDYTMYGGVASKLRGLRHVLAYYSRRFPETLELYAPYKNRECLHCHAGSRGFLAESAHTEEDTTMASMLAGRMSCLEGGCHDVAHGIDELEEVEFWNPRRPPAAEDEGGVPEEEPEP